MFFLAAYGYGLCLAGFAVALEEYGFHRAGRISDRLYLAGWACAEPLGYRQATVVWRLRGLVNFLRGKRAWGTMTRTGFSNELGGEPRG